MGQLKEHGVRTDHPCVVADDGYIIFLDQIPDLWQEIEGHTPHRKIVAGHVKTDLHPSLQKQGNSLMQVENTSHLSIDVGPSHVVANYKVGNDDTTMNLENKYYSPKMKEDITTANDKGKGISKVPSRIACIKNRAKINMTSLLFFSIFGNICFRFYPCFL